MLKVGTEQATRGGGALLLHALTDLFAFLYHKVSANQNSILTQTNRNDHPAQLCSLVIVIS